MPWRLAVGADCCLFLGLYGIVLMLDPERPQLFQSSVVAVAAVIFLSLVPVLLYRYFKATKSAGYNKRSSRIL